MEMKSGYKHTEVGVIPEEWDVKLLGSLATTVASGRTTAWSEFGSYPVHGSTGVIGHTERPAYEGDAILVARVGAYAGKLNTVSGMYGVTDNTIMLRFGTGCVLPYIWRTLESKRLNRLVFGSGQPLITGTQLKALSLSYPPLPEQRAIADALNDVDGLLGGLDRLIAKKRDLKQAVMQQLLTGQTRLPGFHSEWEVKTLGEICELKMGRTPSRLNPSFWGEGYVWLSIADLQSKVVSSSKEQVTKAAAATMELIPKGTLLMSFKLSIGRLCFAGCDLFTNEAICSLNNLKANADYLYYALGRVDFSLYGKQAVKGYTLNKESLKTVKVTLPLPDEQTAIAQVLTGMDAELEAMERRRDKTRASKQAIMQELLTGKTRLVQTEATHV